MIFTAETQGAPRNSISSFLPMTENSASRAWVRWTLAALFLLGAVCFWFCYLAQGIAYGDLFGIAGREADLAAMANHARGCLGLALLLEALAVAMIVWFVSRDVRPLWQRVCFCIVFSSVLDFVTYAIVRGF